MKTRWTDIAVVLTADGVSGAVAPADADDGDRRTGETDENVDALDDDTEQTKEGAHEAVTRILNTLATLECTCIALPTIWSGSGDRKNCKRCNGSELLDHHL